MPWSGSGAVRPPWRWPRGAGEVGRARGDAYRSEGGGVARARPKARPHPPLSTSQSPAAGPREGAWEGTGAVGDNCARPPGREAGLGSRGPRGGRSVQTFRLAPGGLARLGVRLRRRLSGRPGGRSGPGKLTGGDRGSREVRPGLGDASAASNGAIRRLEGGTAGGAVPLADGRGSRHPGGPRPPGPGPGHTLPSPPGCSGHHRSLA